MQLIRITLFKPVLAAILFVSGCASSDLSPPGGFGSTIQEVVSSAPPKSELGAKRLSIKKALTPHSVKISSVQWLDEDSRIVERAVSGEQTSEIVKLETSSLETLVVGRGRNVVASPNGDYLLLQKGSEWYIRNVKDQRDRHIAMASDETRSYTIWHPPRWSRDGRYIAIPEIHAPITSKPLPSPSIINGVRVMDFDASEPAISDVTSRLTIFDVVLHKTVEIVRYEGISTRVDWGPENSLYIAQIDFFGEKPSTTIRKIELGSGRSDIVYETAGRFQSLLPTVDVTNRLVALALDVHNREWPDFVSLLLVDAHTGEEIGILSDNLPIGHDYIWSVDGAGVYALVRRGGLDEVWWFPLVGDPSLVSSGAHRILDLELSPSGSKLSYRTEDWYGRKDIRVFDLQEGVEQVIEVTHEPGPRFVLGKTALVRWQSEDGVSPYGYLFYPPDFEPSKQYPVITYVHGGGAGSRLTMYGPLSITNSRSALEWHAWASAGYIVFLPSYRSTGEYGPSVIAARYDRAELPQVDDAKDIVSGVIALSNEPFIDQNRISIIGHSAGAQRVFAILTEHSGLFSAAVLNEGTAPDVTSMFLHYSTGENLGGYPKGLFQPIVRGDLSEVPERYKNNLMFDAFKNSTPTLIMMGNEELGGEYQVPYEVMHSILRERGTPTRFIEFLDSGHVYKQDAALLAYEEISNWLDEYMPSQK